MNFRKMQFGQGGTSKTGKRFLLGAIAISLVSVAWVSLRFNDDLGKNVEAPHPDFINANLLSKPVKIASSPFYEVNVAMGRTHQPTKCCEFDATKVEFGNHRNKTIVLFMNLMDYTSGTHKRPVKTNDTGKKTAMYLKRLRAIAKTANPNAEVWFVRAQALLPGDELASYEFRTECLYKPDEKPKGIVGDLCFDKFLIFSNRIKGKFTGNNAGLKYWVSKNCPGSNLQDLDQYTENSPAESHHWPITCLVDPKGYSRLANDDYQKPELLYNRILKISGDNAYAEKAIGDLGLPKTDYPDFPGWVVGER